MNVKTLTYRIQLSDNNSFLFNRHEVLEVEAEIQPGDNLRECAIELIKLGNSSLFNPLNPRHQPNQAEPIQSELIDPDIPPEVEEFIHEDYIPTDDDEDDCPY